jgi:glucose-1-phosphate cytidylyltransferase
MKVIILAGGLGTRLSEYTDSIPKPMVQVGGKPILWHIMEIFGYFGYKEFIIALGYKPEIIKDYFLSVRSLNSDFTVNLLDGEVLPHTSMMVDWKVTLVDTGRQTMTGGRIKRLKKFIGNETCLITYGDGVGNIDINKLTQFHKQHKKMITLTAVRPAARFGELDLHGNIVKKFEEKPQLHEGWINGGFFVVEPEFFDLIEGDETLLEREPLEIACQRGELMAYKHEGFWQCMDTKRDHEMLEGMYAKGQAPWKFK